MSDPIVVSAIAAFSTVLVAVVTTFGAKINGRLRRVQGQVENSHPVNLRDELDARHKETREWFQYLKYRQDTQDERMDRIIDVVEVNKGRLDRLEGKEKP